MTAQQSGSKGIDLTQGVPLGDIADDGMVAGRVGDEAVVLVRRGSEFFAIGSTCSHYGGPLAEGLVVGETVRCPWHHACFSLRTGEAIAAPAFKPMPCWRVEQRDGKVFVAEKLPSVSGRRLATTGLRHAKPGRVVIVGGGAAGFAAAEMLRREAFDGEITILSADDAAPYDRPNCSKDYLAGKAPENWMPLASPDFYTNHAIDLKLRAEVTRVDAHARLVTLADGRTLPYDKLLLTTGAEPNRLAIPGADRAHVHTLRSIADSRAIIAKAEVAKRAVVLGASFIGLEVAAALRARNLKVHVVAPDRRPLERVLGPGFGDFIRAIHEEHGVVFHPEETAVAIDAAGAKLKGGAVLPCDLVVVGIGVRPRIGLAERAGLRIDSGVAVDEYLETSAPGIFAAGDIARWPDARTGENVRIEHWVLAQRQGQAAARNMLGQRLPFTDVPFFWSQHYDVPINYVGHAAQWDDLEVEGDIAARDCLVRYRRNGKLFAAASIFRDVASLEAELSLASRAAVS
jgi:NADPH-dependent 2,4-dienoyl-CoA reductase/sulfur reductase-like enzyme/nitrite reductase/ring-hydroxylating ferredoxin subunit